MNTSAISLEIKSDTSELPAAMAKLHAITDMLPVTAANFIADAGGSLGLIDFTVDGLGRGAVTLGARPSEKLQRFLDMFSEDDLSDPAPQSCDFGKDWCGVMNFGEAPVVTPLAPDETRQNVADCKFRFVGVEPLSFGGFPRAQKPVNPE